LARRVVREHIEKALLIFWPMGGVLSGSLLIAGATEVLSFFLSRGLAFALLAFLQVLPEFAVEAVLTHQAGIDPSKLAFVSANFTGANRLIVGLFLPMVFFVAAWRARAHGQTLKEIRLERESGVEISVLFIANAYSFLIPLKGTLSLWDALFLGTLYAAYLAMLYRMPPSVEDEKALPGIPRMIRTWPVNRQKLAITFMFILGGGLLLVSVHPFVENTKELAFILGVSAFFMLQWLAPFLSEFPEFITILYWAKTGRSQHGLTNAVSSKVSQWTLLLAMIPLVYLYSTWSIGALKVGLEFDAHQRVEILLTAVQGLFATLCLVDLKFGRWQAWTLATLWFVQVFDPILDQVIRDRLPLLAWSPLGTGAYIREWEVFIYFGLCIALVIQVKGHFRAFVAFREVWNEHIRRRPLNADAPRTS
jgi:cation:H+ antiporter